VTISVTNGSPPSPPSDADFAIYIDFEKDAPNPQRIFQTAESLITALQKIDHKLCKYVDSSIEPILVLEEIETGSLKIWLKNLLSATDDQGIKELDWKPLVGQYLVKAKYLYIEWANNLSSKEDGKGIQKLANDIQTLAVNTNIKHLPDYVTPSTADIVEGIQQISDAKSFLGENDKLKYVGEEAEIEFNLAISWTPEKFDELLTREIIENPQSKMILAVKKPDYLGNSKWDLRHGKTAISAKVEDEEWLKRFQSREEDVRPGDSLRCQVIQTLHYGFDNELISTEYRIVKVECVLANEYRQQTLPSIKER